MCNTGPQAIQVVHQITQQAAALLRTAQAVCKEHNIDRYLLLYEYTQYALSVLKKHLDQDVRFIEPPIRFVTPDDIDTSLRDFISQQYSKRYCIEPKDKNCPAHDIQDGQCFRKVNGTTIYRRISKSSVKFHGLNNDLVYGIGRNGNTTTVRPGTLVVRVNESNLDT
jgi:hypothetical protein